MKTTKLVIGIISIILSVLVLLQSCAAGVSNTLQDNGEAGGSAGTILAICLLVAGIVAIATRKEGNGGFIASGFYIAGALLGFLLAGSYKDLTIWATLSAAFGLIFIFGDLRARSK